MYPSTSELPVVKPRSDEARLDVLIDSKLRFVGITVGRRLAALLSGEVAIDLFAREPFFMFGIAAEGFAGST